MIAIRARTTAAVLACMTALVLLSACQRADLSVAHAAAAVVPAQETSFYTIVAKMKAPVPAMMALGQRMFMDPSLSASGRLACASCHAPSRAYAPDNNLSVQPGGPDMNRLGTRAAPSLRYVYNVPSFTEHFYDDEDGDGSDQGPTGGHTFDGRVQTFHEQVVIPLTAAHEMANKDPEAVVERVKASSYSDAFRKTFGANIFDEPQKAFTAIQMAFEAFLETPAEFYPYSSKFDTWMRGKAQLTSSEVRGFALFNDPEKGNCGHCHISKPSSHGVLPSFTDWGHIAIGVPRNNALPANAKPAYYDLGLCGPDRTDLKDKGEYCGLFRTPSLRNVATRKAFFHNGVMHSLSDVVRFYSERDTKPEKWYPRRADGQINKFDDLPDRYRSNVNMEPPFGRHPGERAALTDHEIHDIVAFLGTLTDGYMGTVAKAK